MKNNEKILLGVACFLGGVVAGFLIAPIKKGMEVENNCGNHITINKEELQDIIGREDLNIEKNGEIK